MRENSLNKITLFALFCSSFSPLFLLIVIKQIGANWEYLEWGGINGKSLLIWLEKFSLTTYSIFAMIYGSLGTYFLLQNLKRRTINNGDRVIIIKASNKNDQFLIYLVSYIIPFLSLGSSSITDSICILILLFFLCSLYLKSSLIMINPILSFFGYNLYEVEYEFHNMTYENIILIRSNDLEKGGKITIRKVGWNILFAINNL